MYTPTEDQFVEMSKRGNLIPVSRDILADLETPVSAFLKIRGGPYSFLLESVVGGESVARYSFLGADPRLVMKSKGRTVEVTGRQQARTRELQLGEDPLTVLKELLERHAFVPRADLPRFCGGAVGFMSYDLVRFFEELPDSTEDDLQIPDCVFLFTDVVLIFDHVQHKIKVLTNAEVQDDPREAYRAATQRIEQTILKLATTSLPPPTAPPAVSEGTIRSNFERTDFEATVERCKEYILAGDAFQIVPSQRFERDISTPTFQIYRALRSINPSPYMYYLTLDDVHIIGSSPEILVTEDGGKVTTRPLAGTRRRGATAAEDDALAQELLADPKECAEHVMLVDLGRNDIGRVCVNGSVRVDELMGVEKYSHVVHVVSNVVGDLAPGRDQFDVLRACFPAGTVSGAPKIRAMEILDELEPTRRGPYAGAIGYFSHSGNMDTAITIRTIVARGDKAYVQAGAGIVADSVPATEYEETVNKAKALMKAIDVAEAGLQ
ncbi:MAG: anthranilate synthase component I [Armatimonadetes bacterium CG_4_10_14_0_8_um_filter_66_14]|nr:anthranilate synthase component I [Armatimonadota bacterium]OIO97830.1 MAG: anthranilate synthase component I [Armatimonadetes bacterium CG2_30_66_41]PIU95386.1 MAG: anthranilate synthase component I [Armatimonadetes bacterium CG06_land_8_20_14_3_00_66_21]PIX37805.1 MAG: anthranilate synthase component I [Armatimonadetes bacterium CG_4_8_14_3_um_filter_66_20]PIZ43042.1 MAG: anthranilate synthase component I [Armatimonadetes bacterium CG_4_10_14_0_8_um_filter_66_14]PJB74520.1 MAG: anthranila